MQMRKVLQQNEVVGVLRGLLRALAALHAAGTPPLLHASTAKLRIVHRDVKPANIMLSPAAPFIKLSSHKVLATVALAGVAFRQLLCCDTTAFRHGITPMASLHSADCTPPLTAAHTSLPTPPTSSAAPSPLSCTSFPHTR
eukprot:640774-Rhodomonas_salina.2